VDPTTRRAVEVTGVLARQAAAAGRDVVARTGVLGKRSKARVPAGPVLPRRFRTALEQLGPTFVKLGQVLSTRPDLVPPSFEAELARLQDSTRAEPWPTIRAALERGLRVPLDQAYKELDRRPLASASIGQVHGAVLHDGRAVVVKVRRAGVVDRVRIDLELLARVARVASRYVRFVRRYDPVGLAREFSVTLGGELDYAREGRNAEELAAEMAHHPGVGFPAVEWDHCGDGVLTEERIFGTKIDDLAALDAAGISRVDVARTFADAYLAMVFRYRFFHADPHPGNVFVRPDGSIGFVDFGMVGSVPDATAQGLTVVMLALVSRDPAQMADALLHLGIATGDVDRPALERDLERLLARYGDVELSELHIGPLLAQLMGVVRRHRLCLPSDLALLIKTVMMCEGVAAQLDPAFRLVPMLVPYAMGATGSSDEAAG
jgi:ubiquinone biosynthesis protein